MKVGFSRRNSVKVFSFMALLDFGDGAGEGIETFEGFVSLFFGVEIEYFLVKGIAFLFDASAVESDDDGESVLILNVRYNLDYLFGIKDGFEYVVVCVKVFESE